MASDTDSAPLDELALQYTRAVDDYFRHLTAANARRNQAIATANNGFEHEAAHARASYQARVLELRNPFTPAVAAQRAAEAELVEAEVERVVANVVKKVRYVSPK